jgi:hypothetical protein
VDPALDNLLVLTAALKHVLYADCSTTTDNNNSMRAKAMCSTARLSTMIHNLCNIDGQQLPTWHAAHPCKQRFN